MMKAIDNNTDQHIHVTVTRCICIFWIIAKLISWKLWLANRIFPIVPLSDFLQLPSLGHLMLLIFSLALLLVIAIKPFKRILLLLLFIAELLSCLLDQTRWQPWQYQYLTILFIFLLYYKKRSLIIPAVSFVLFATYLYSGLSKFNLEFIKDVWQNMILHSLKIPTRYVHSHILYYAGYSIPILEIVSALFLSFIKMRKTGAVLLILTHLFILIVFGPLGMNANIIVWPWNVVMIILLSLLFIKHPNNKIDFKTMLNKNLLWLAIVWGLLPLTSYIGFWDDYLSSNLYSGQTKKLEICISNNQQIYPEDLIPFFQKKEHYKRCPDAKLILVNRWCLQEMKVPCYPEKRVFEKLKKIIQDRYKDCVFTFTIY